jgi:hypothetical protein
LQDRTDGSSFCSLLVSQQQKVNMAAGLELDFELWFFFFFVVVVVGVANDLVAAAVDKNGSGHRRHLLHPRSSAPKL